MNNHREIMEALLQGKKLRKVSWGLNEYVYLEECIEYVDFFTMIKHVLNGGKAKRKHWLGSICFKNIHYPDKTLVFEEPLPEDEALQFDMGDIKATDWILL